MATPPYPPPGFPPDPRAARDYARQQRAQLRMARDQARLQRAQFRNPRHRSILGPILLVVIGVVMMLINTHHLNPDHFFDVYRRFWPVILIAVGVLLALEAILVSRWRHVRTYGGPIATIIFLAMIGVCATAFHDHGQQLQSMLGMQHVYGVPNTYGFNGVALHQLFGHKHQASQQVQFPIATGGTLIVQNPHGDLIFTAGTGTQLQVTLQKTVYADSDDHAQSKMDALQATLTTAGNVTTLRVNSDDSAGADLTLTVPPTVAIEAHSHNGDVTLAGDAEHGNWRAPVTVDSQHGDVHLSNISATVLDTLQSGDFIAKQIQGPLTLHGRMNDVTISDIHGPVILDGDFFGDVQLEKIPAPVHFHSSRTQMEFARVDGSVSLHSRFLRVDNAPGPARVETRAKNVVMTGASGELHLDNSDGNVNITTVAPLGKMEVHNHSGDVRVTLPANAHFTVNATATDGNLQDNFNLPTENNDYHTSVSGAVNGGGPLLTITSEKGNVSLDK